jgi:hypothetical protein
MGTYEKHKNSSEVLWSSSEIINFNPNILNMFLHYILSSIEKTFKILNNNNLSRC